MDASIAIQWMLFWHSTPLVWLHLPAEVLLKFQLSCWLSYTYCTVLLTEYAHNLTLLLLTLFLHHYFSLELKALHQCLVRTKMIDILFSCAQMIKLCLDTERCNAIKMLGKKLNYTKFACMLNDDTVQTPIWTRATHRKGKRSATLAQITQLV